MNKKMFLILLVCIIAISLVQCRQSGPSKQEGNSAPDFSLQDIQGNAFKLSSQKGNPVVMFFGTTWCPACRGEMPFYKALYEKYAGRGLKFLYIDINESTERVARFAKLNSFPYLVLVDSDGSVANDYNIIGVPTVILVDEKGKIIGESHRVSDLPLNNFFTARK
jgi:peroxiredoxin